MAALKTRQATLQELVHYLRINTKIRYRHWVREHYAPRARNGVRHQQYSTSKIAIIDGVPHVSYRGEVEALTASWFDTGKCGGVFDIRVRGLGAF